VDEVDWLLVVVAVVVTVLVEVELVVVDPLAITAVCACSPLPSTVTMYFCPDSTPCVGVCPCNSSKAPIVITPL
jgi:hypothetical protein